MGPQLPTHNCKFQKALKNRRSSLYLAQIYLSTNLTLTDTRLFTVCIYPA